VLNHGFKYRPIPVYMGNIVSDFEVPNTILTSDIRADITDMTYIANNEVRYQYCRFWY